MDLLVCVRHNKLDMVKTWLIKKKNTGGDKNMQLQTYTEIIVPEEQGSYTSTNK